MDNPGWLVRFRSAIVRCIVVALVGGSLVALTASLFAVSYVDLIAKMLLVVAMGFAVPTGIIIALLADRAKTGGWWGYLTKVSVSIVCALISGIWAELLVSLILGEPEPVVSLLNTLRNGAGTRVDEVLVASSFFCIVMAFLVAALSGKKGK